MKHAHVLSFAFTLQALQAYLLLQQDYPQVSQDRHISRVFFPPFLCIGLNVWGQDRDCEVQQSCCQSAHVLRTFHSVCLKATLPAHTGSAGHPHLPNCSQSLQLSLLQINAFISIFIFNSRIQATAPVWKPFMSEVVLKVCLDGIPSSEVAVRTRENSCHYSL